jgi:hypothetical protein
MQIVTDLLFSHDMLIAVIGAVIGGLLLSLFAALFWTSPRWFSNLRTWWADSPRDTQPPEVSCLHWQRGARGLFTFRIITSRHWGTHHPVVLQSNDQQMTHALVVVAATGGTT